MLGYPMRVAGAAIEGGGKGVGWAKIGDGTGETILEYAGGVHRRGGSNRGACRDGGRCWTRWDGQGAGCGKLLAGTVQCGCCCCAGSGAACGDKGEGDLGHCFVDVIKTERASRYIMIRGSTDLDRKCQVTASSRTCQGDAKAPKNVRANQSSSSDPFCLVADYSSPSPSKVSRLLLCV